LLNEIEKILLKCWSG